MDAEIMPVLILALLIAVAPAHGALSNQLARHPSPYLAMHAEDPVHWQIWGADTVERARRENKLLYVSVGYFSCHWCHVMQRESYQDQAIARQLNENFVPVKVDRELNPALDAHLIEFVERTRGYAGWPLNVFITPAGHPLVGIVYLPPNDFLQLVQRLSALWARDTAELTEIAAEAGRGLQPSQIPFDPGLPAGIGSRYQKALVTQALASADFVAGGFGDQNKFPHVPQLNALLAALEQSGNGATREFLVTTLDQMMRFGLHDLLGDGFFRYTVDPAWRTPHFEKMLYDNALLAQLYLWASRVLEQPRYEKQARRTLDFLIREFGTEDGAFVASLSAVDDRGVEGGYYLWDNNMLAALLTAEERRAAARAWDMQGQPELDAGHLPVALLSAPQVAEALDDTEARVSALLTSARTKLLTARSQRHLPKDGKQLAAWNGLALVALARAASLQDGSHYRDAAGRLHKYLARQLWNGEQLLRAASGDEVLSSGALEDYAYVAAGFLAWAELTDVRSDWELVRKVVAQGWKRFHGPHGWRLGEQSLLAYGGDEAVVADGPMPSPSAVLVQVSLQVARYFDDSRLRDRALAALNSGRDVLARDPFRYATHVTVMAEVQKAPASADGAGVGR